MQHYFRNEASMAIATQFVIVLIFCPLLFLLKGSQWAVSFLAGGMLCVLPNLYLYRRVFAHFGARAAKQIFRAFYFGELVKMLLTGIGFVGAALSGWILPAALFTGYGVAQLAFWVAPFVWSKLRAKRAMENTLLLTSC